MDIQKARKYLLDKEREETELADRRFAAAQKVFQEIVQYIKDNYQPSEIRKCGSLLFREIFTKNSDIDIAVRGIGFKDLLALHLKFEMKNLFRIHLIDIDSLGAPDKRVLLKYSEIVHQVST